MTWIEKITEKIKRRVPLIMEDTQGESLIIDLIDDALTQIVTYANANAYDKKWDNLLVTSVVTLYNYEGMEGSTSRNANGVSDVYNSSYILSELLASGITPYLRPCGYVYSPNRFDYPKD